ncbi:hypothetical protein AB4Z46_14680 [Variovorax sp. M-6]|uniref:hypothetical protein n=1 Tax=Variovorax sp. M-6 TaxID=3233041 RepID=UPI003F94BF80
MKKTIAILFAASVCLLAGCASRGTDGSAGTANTGGSGITVFGTIDAGVSNYKNQSR